MNYANNGQKGWSRRQFIGNLTAAGATMMLNPLFLSATASQDPRIAEIVARTIGVDTHNHIDVPLVTAELPGASVDLAGELKRSGLSAICMTFALDYQRLSQEGEAYERFLNGLSAMDEVLKSNHLTRSLNLADLQRAHNAHQPTVIQSVEGGHFLEGKVGRVEVAYQRGLRQLGLLHDSDASTPLGDVYTNPPRWGGLSSFGAEVIRECNRLGILVDLTHASNDTINAALKVATKPVIVSHTGLDTRLGTNEMMAKMMRPRLISKEQAKIVADAGGVIGVWTHLAESALEYAQNLKAMAEVVGVDHVAIGTDTKMTLSYRSPGPSDAKPGGGAPPPNGGKPGGGRMGEHTNEPWQAQKTGFYYAVVEAMLATGFTEAEIGKIGGGNFCRVFDAATSGRQYPKRTLFPFPTDGSAASTLAERYSSL